MIAFLNIFWYIMEKLALNEKEVSKILSYQLKESDINNYYTIEFWLV